MMAKTSIIRVRLEPELKAEVESIFEELGLTTTEAIRLFYTQVKRKRALPFGVKIPNKETRKVLRESEQGINLVHCDSLEDMWNKLGI